MCEYVLKNAFISGYILGLRFVVVVLVPSVPAEGLNAARALASLAKELKS